MSLLFGTEVVLFSPLDGKITYEGKPVANAPITRLVKWKDDVGKSETFYSDDHGNFHLPLMKAKVRIPPLAEFVISQSIFVNYGKQEFQVWGRTKRGIELYDELGGRPVDLQCELTDEVNYIDVPDGLFGTSCKWTRIEKQGE